VKLNGFVEEFENTYVTPPISGNGRWGNLIIKQNDICMIKIGRHQVFQQWVPI
jgi:hypothetical protein